ncbi:hypothetical protein A8E21_33160, partial [Burkholderia cenocepacia]
MESESQPASHTEFRIPPPKPRREKNPGRLPVSNRAALTGILFVLKTGLRWR